MLKFTQRLEATSDAVASDSVTLPFELRCRGRLKATSDSGREIGLFLDRGPVLRDGALLRAESGEIVEVLAADEPVVTARVTAGLELARLCYHLGNRHVQLAIGCDGESGWVRFPPDHVLEALAARLGASLEHHQAPFDPEPGAYAEGHSHGHAHGHDHGHSHEPGPSHEPGHSHEHDHEHDHGHSARILEFRAHRGSSHDHDHEH
ncbi:urease accessory protein UreE [Salinicola avicenniae]|uniref:urease accessory protein UreE n=1 Tax=Salinicola avicenniae TaxID=2916836 RepID=UPI002074347A|nr:MULTISPECIES: urease accessory protein UreE [unclassified Salinicola]